MTHVPCRWFVNKISRSDAEDTLLEKNSQGDFTQKDGAFIVRPSESSPGDFSLSVKYVINLFDTSIGCLFYRTNLMG